MTGTWERKQWAALVGLLVLVILVLTLWPREPSAPAYDHVIVRVVDGPTVLSTQVVPLR